MVNFLLEEGARIDARDVADFTALHETADRGHPEIVELLLRKGASVAWRDRYFGSTPLHCAAQAEFTDPGVMGRWRKCSWHVDPT